MSGITSCCDARLWPCSSSLDTRHCKIYKYRSFHTMCNNCAWMCTLCVAMSTSWMGWQASLRTLYVPWVRREWVDRHHDVPFTWPRVRSEWVDRHHEVLFFAWPRVRREWVDRHHDVLFAGPRIRRELVDSEEYVVNGLTGITTYSFRQEYVVNGLTVKSTSWMGWQALRRTLFVAKRTSWMG